ncbi:MAG: sigma-54 dependent transcriptional regulator [Proteobacteria bacterium]|nr:sigma-54 dependent transcriptional regulator [Pseudomonadota bacterium]
MTTILIVDDDPQLRNSFKKVLDEEGYRTQTASSGAAGIEVVKRDMPDLVIMDVRMPDMNGFEAFKIMHGIEPRLPVIIMTAYGTTETAIETTKMGAFDYVLKPFEIPDILELIKKGLHAGRCMRSRVQMDVSPENVSEDAIVGKSKPMQEIYKSIGRVAPTDATVLIRGESGTGKELVARAVYQHSQRHDQSFLVINCVAIPETLLESELFGYEKGAFTGAAGRRVGKIEQANRGTVFLDEIGDMPFNIQSKILRLLQEKSIERLGGRNAIPVDVRIIAATNRNLEEAVSSGTFREDLYYRLKVVTLSLPPLRERTEDISFLADHFLSRFSHAMGIPNPGADKEAKNALITYPWPGNVRELANVIQKALIFNQGTPISKDDILRTSDGENHLSRMPTSDTMTDIDKIMRDWVHQKIQSSSSEHTFEDIMDYFAEILTREALNLSQGNRSQAAKILGLSRPTLLAKIDRYKIKMST